MQKALLLTALLFSACAATTEDNLQGKWTSLDDPQHAISFEGTTKYDLYDDETLSQGAFTITNELPESKLPQEGPYLIVEEEKEAFTYAITELTEDKLTMMYLPRGNILRYGR